MRSPATALAVRLAAASLLVLLLPGPGPSGFPSLHALHQTAPVAPVPARIDVDRLMADVRILSAPEMEGRLAGTPGSRRARAFILDRFRRLGLQRVNGSHQQQFKLDRPRARLASQPIEGANLFGMIAGTTEPQEYVLVGAHYDHLGSRGGRIYPGADDNASGVAALLAVAGWFAEHPPGRSVLFVAFDAEEQGLQGAKHFVASPPVDLRRMIVMINVDMVGRSTTHTLVVAGTHHYPALKPAVIAAAEGRRLRIAFGHDRPAVLARGAADWTHASDHGPFHSAGVPFLYFGVENHPDYHRPTDTADRLDRQFYAEATDLVLETVRILGDR